MTWFSAALSSSTVFRVPFWRHTLTARRVVVQLMQFYLRDVRNFAMPAFRCPSRSVRLELKPSDAKLLLRDLMLWLGL